MADPLKPTRRRLNIMSALATGWLPWGVEWKPWLVQSGNRFTLCCGHVLSKRETDAFVGAGLLEQTLDTPNRLTITPAGRTWLGRNWKY